jgi:hypothetical protein
MLCYKRIFIHIGNFGRESSHDMAEIYYIILFHVHVHRVTLTLTGSQLHSHAHNITSLFSQVIYVQHIQ